MLHVTPEKTKTEWAKQGDERRGIDLLRENSLKSKAGRKRETCEGTNLLRSHAWRWHAPPLLSCTWLPGNTQSPCQAYSHALCIPNPNSPLRKWRRITSICTTHAPLIENKALFVLYHSFTLSALSGFCSLLSVFLLLLRLPSFLLCFFILSPSVCRIVE